MQSDVKTRDGSVVAFSGGIDSTTVLAEAVRRYGASNVIAVGFNYGQKHVRELAQARKIAAFYLVEFVLVNLPQIFAGAGSTLVDDDATIEMMGTYEELAKKYGAQPTVVPNRNMHIISSCATIALTRGVNHVMLGVHGTDASNWHYPDCHPDFIGAMAAAINIGNSGLVQLEAPFNYWSKGQIIERAAELKVPASLTQSCYNGKRPHCGECATCHERKIAFYEAGYHDPTYYEVEDTRNNEPHLKTWPMSANEIQLLQEEFGRKTGFTSS